MEGTLLSVVRELIARHDFRLPIQAASLSANGASLVTRVEEPSQGNRPGSVVIRHVAGDVGDEGFVTPVHILLTDSLGRARVAITRGTGVPTLYKLTEN